MISSRKKEVISFKDFMSRPATPIRKEIPLHNNIYSFLPVITVEGLFPLHETGFLLFVIGGALIVGAAYLERVLAKNDLTGFAAILSSIGAILFPVIAYGAVFWLLFFGLRGI